MKLFSLNDSEVYFRDDFMSFSDANLSIASSPVLYGLSVYTVFSANWNEKQQKLYMFRLKDHYDRLIQSAKIMDFHQFVEVWDYEGFQKVVTELLKKNNIQEDVLIRATVFIDEIAAGTKIHGLKNSFSAYVYPLGEILPRSGIHACVSSWQRTPDNAIPSRAKINGSYVNASLMKNEALLNGYDDAIAVDEHGHVSEGTVANLFLVKKNKLITPHGATDILEGITRRSIIAIAEKEGIVCEERSVDRSELYTADEVFMCGSSAIITPVLSIDKRVIGDGKIGALTRRFSELYNKVQKNEDIRFSDWCEAI